MWKALINLVKKWGCRHHWKTYQTSKVFASDFDKTPIRIDHTLICKKCGEIRKITI